MKIQWVKRTSEGISLPKKFVEKSLNFFLSHLKVKHKKAFLGKKTLILVFLEAGEMSSLNFRFRKKKTVTDVLSFESLESEVLGELVLCPSVIREQSQRHGLPFREELVYLVLHGILHLLGYEHEKNKKEAQRMYALQDDLFDEFLKEL